MTRAGGAHAAEPGAPAPGTFVHELFQGKLVSETRCLQCETVTNREEAFKDLSLEIEQNSSITACLRNFRRAQSSQKMQAPCLHCFRCSMQYLSHRMPAQTLS